MTSPPRTLDPRRWRALWVSQLAAFMALLDVSIVNVAMPSIMRDLAVPPATAQWVVSGYALALGLALVPAGRVGDMWGRRPLFLASLAAFVVTSALTGAAPGIGWLIAARVLQGLTGGVLIPQNAGLIQDLFTGAERGRAFGILGGTVGLSVAAGPVIGGLILAAVPGSADWRWVFYVNVPIGLVAFLFAFRRLPRSDRSRQGLPDLDIVGTLLLGAGVFTLLLPLVTAEGGTSTRWWWLWGVAVVLFGAFGMWEVLISRRGRQPLLAPELTRIPGYSAGSGIGLTYFVGFTGIWLVLALYFQDGLGYSPLKSGLAVTPFALGVAVAAPVAGRLVARAGRWVTVMGLAAVIVGLALTALVLARSDTAITPWLAIAPLLFAGLGGGMVTTPNITLSLQHVPVRMAGVAGGALQTAQRVGSAIGTAVLATVFYRTLTRTNHDYHAAVSDALLYACGFMVLALLLAVTELARRRPCPSRHPEHCIHHL